MRHWEGNDLGHLAPVLDELGLSARYWDAHRDGAFPDPAGYRGIVMLGAHYNVDDVSEFPALVPEKQFIRDAVGAGVPLFGICFGAQLLANAFGAPVRRETFVEKGWVDIELTGAGRLDPVFGGFAPVLRQFHWHNDSFEMPENGVLLGQSAGCPTQILRVGDRAYGVQFHPEVVPPVIEEWMGMSKTRPEAWKEAIRAETRSTYEAARREGQAMFRAFWQRML